MGFWTDKSVLITGAGSGIGLAFARELARRGARVWLTDINESAVAEASEDIGHGAVARVLDVTDATGFRAIVEEIRSQHGTMDVLFNNAGIAVAGIADEMDTSHFNKTTDINIRGVTNGVVAVYDAMVTQGAGMIVNTASAAGLLPVPALAAYAMSKHAVVGLSGSLRIEAAARGIQVSALCPAAVETPLLDADNPPDTGQAWRPDLREYLTEMSGAPYPVDAFVNYALAQLERNRGVIVAPASARFTLLLAKLFPGIAERRAMSAYQKLLDKRG